MLDPVENWIESTANEEKDMFNHPALLVVVATQHQQELIEKANEYRLIAEARRARRQRSHDDQPIDGNRGRHWRHRAKNTKEVSDAVARLEPCEPVGQAR